MTLRALAGFDQKSEKITQARRNSLFFTEWANLSEEVRDVGTIIP
jgi:hypothetical protein